MPLTDNLASKEFSNSLNLEQNLINFYEYSLDSYKKKLYENLYREVELNESLIYFGTKESFKILILKIKCLMKLMIEKYENEMNDINDEEMSVKEYINKIQREFLKLNAIIKKDDYDEYENITQLYCKFLIYLIKFSQKKEEYYKSLGYMTLGINMIKIFFIRKKIAKDIKLYKRYIYFLLLLINHLIGEGNFTQALLYSEIILKVIEKGTKLLYSKESIFTVKNENHKNKQLMELIRCSGFVHIYIGLCFQIQKNQEPAMEAYRQAFYYFMKLKSDKFLEIQLNDDKIFYDNNFVKISHWFFTNIKNKITEEQKKKEKAMMNLLLESIDDKKNENYEKKKKLALVSSGLNENQKRYNIIENNLFTNVLNSKNNKIIEKLDRALMTLAYDEKKKPQLGKKNKMSHNTMETMCHYKIYNKLLTPNYQEFIMSHKNIKLSNPKDEEEFIHEVNSYLTQNMEINSGTNQKNKNKNNKIKSEKNRKKIKRFFSESYKFKNKDFNLQSSMKIQNKKELSSYNSFLDSLSEKDISKDIKTPKKLSFKRNFNFSSLKLNIPRFSSNLFYRPMVKSFSDIHFSSKTLSTQNIKLSKKSKSKAKKDSIMNWSKNIYLNPKYFKNYMKLDNLIRKELNFQKDILNLKGNNSKLYHRSFSKEIFVTGKDKEDEMNKDYMILTEKIDQKVINNQKEYEKLIYFNIKKKQNDNKKFLLKHNRKSIKVKDNNELVDDEILGINKKLKFGNNEEEKNYNEINKKSIFSITEKLKNIIHKMRERKHLLKLYQKGK